MRRASEEEIPGRAALSVGNVGSAPPEGWVRTRLTDVARLESGHTPSRRHSEYWDGDVPWVGLRDARLHDGGEIHETLQTITNQGLANSAARWLPKGTVCLSRTASVGYVVVLGRPMATSQDFVNWVCSSALDHRFLKYALAAEGDHLREFGKGTTHTTIYFPAVLALHICLPPVAEQRRIVDRVEALLREVNAARSCLVKVPRVLRHFRQSVLAAACSGGLIEPTLASEEWPSTSVGDLLIDAKYGTSDRCGDRTRGSVPVLRVPNIASGRLDLTSLKFALPQRNWDALMLRDGDILICRTNGSLDLVGKAAIVANLPEAAAFASYLIRLRTNTQALLPRFLHLFLLSPSGRAQITAEARTTAGQFNLNLDILRRLQLILPPVDAQVEIIRRVDDLFSLADTIERCVGMATGRADSLAQAILAKAFRGELVPTEAELARAEGRDYEHAEALLGRIRSERAASAPVPTGRRGLARRVGARA